MYSGGSIETLTDVAKYDRQSRSLVSRKIGRTRGLPECQSIGQRSRRSQRPWRSVMLSERGFSVMSYRGAQCLVWVRGLQR